MESISSCWTKIVQFKAYDQSIKLDLAVAAEKLVGPNHISRIIDEMVERIDMELLSAYYKGGGCPAYHPKLMIKVWLYGFCEQLYTSRPLAKALGERIPFIWLAGGARPCFKTLSSFRGERMQDLIDEVFKAVLYLLIQEGYIDLEDLFVDGSKWEANANKHKVVWGKNTERWKAQVLGRINAFLLELKELQAAEDAKYGSKDLPESEVEGEVSVILSRQEVEQQLEGLNTRLSAQKSAKDFGSGDLPDGDPELDGCSKDSQSELEAKDLSESTQESKPVEVSNSEELEAELAQLNDGLSLLRTATLDSASIEQFKQMNRTGKKLAKEAEKLLKYEAQEEILAGRNSYSKTDHEATFFRMKDDRLLPAYSPQQMTNHQYIVNYTIAQQAADSPTLPAHIDKALQGFEGLPVPKQQNVNTDAAYGSEENYLYLAQIGMNAYVKYAMFHQEQNGELAKKKFRRENFPYDSKTDTFECPDGRRLEFVEERLSVSKNGYERTIRLYASESCQGCS